MILADYSNDFQPLSNRHEALMLRTARLLEQYQTNVQIHPTYAVIGTFGAGKTQFLYWLHRSLIAAGLVPILVLAEDLFSEVIRTERTFTQGDVAALVEVKIKSVLSALSGPNEGAFDVISSVVDPRGNSPHLVRSIVDAFAGKLESTTKPVLLVDELEGQYRSLQNIVQTPGDRSPLRELFESPVLKFLALAPAGIYEMGGADQTRTIRLVIPSADIRYVRSKLVADAGKANACWWLSRGKARHLFKACYALRDLPADIGAAQVGRIIRDELDQIGQHPTEVPAAVTAGLSSKLPFLFTIAPITFPNSRCYHIDAGLLNEGEMAERLAEAFTLHTDVALQVAEYFRITALSLSDAAFHAFIPDNELADLLCLSLDHLLEYEYGSPALTSHMGELLGLYERFRNDPGAVHGNVGRLWENRLSTQRLPISIAELRRAFPFPLMNPIVKQHNPTEMQRQWEGNGLPLWRWMSGQLLCLFFASARDFSRYVESDDFVSLVLPDGAAVLALFPPDGIPTATVGLANWCKGNSKLKLEHLPQLLADFLLSGTGELTSLPGDLDTQLASWSEDKTDVILNRKAHIYSDALSEIVHAANIKPKLFMNEPLPDADNVWGSTQISDRTVAIVTMLLAWSDVTPDQKALLAKLRELFRTGKEGRGSGEFSKFKLRPGLPSMADELLPRHGRSKLLADSLVVQRLRDYWPNDIRTEMVKLAHDVPLEKFLKLKPDENSQRVLESLWRHTRRNYDFPVRARTLDECIVNLEGDVLPALATARSIEQKAKEILNVTGIDFGDSEDAVKAIGAFTELLEMLKSCQKESNRGSFRGILELFGSSFDLSKCVRDIQLQCEAAQRSINRLQQSAANITNNFWEYPKAIAYLEIEEGELKDFVNQAKSVGESCTLKQLAEEAATRADRLDESNTGIGSLEESLQNIFYVLGNDTEGGN